MRATDDGNAQYFRTLRRVKLGLACVLACFAVAVFWRGGSDFLVIAFVLFSGACLDLPVIAALEKIVPWGRREG